jgi:hypothetical protein
MASIRMVPEDEAVGRVKTVYEEIKQKFGIDFVPNLYRVMASNPGYLEANWNKVKAVMIAPGKLDRLTKEIIAVAVSAVQGVGIDFRYTLLRCRSWDWTMPPCSSSWPWSISSVGSISSWTVSKSSPTKSPGMAEGRP